MILNKNYNLEKIVQVAFNIHNSARSNDVEFIIGCYEDKLDIGLYNLYDHR